MQVTYEGPNSEVTLAPAYGSHVLVRGEPVEVPDDVAKSLSRQPGFRVGGSPRRSRRPDIETRDTNAQHAEDGDEQ